jgi:hypothetical protein
MNPLVVAIAALAFAADVSSASAQAGDAPSPAGEFASPSPIDRQPAPRTSQSLDGVRNGTTREERDRHGGPGEIDLPGRPGRTGQVPVRQN